jgi:hypothetical protein
LTKDEKIVVLLRTIGNMRDMQLPKADAEEVIRIVKDGCADWTVEDTEYVLKVVNRLYNERK